MFVLLYVNEKSFCIHLYCNCPVQQNINIVKYSIDFRTFHVIEQIVFNSSKQTRLRVESHYVFDRLQTRLEKYSAKPEGTDSLIFWKVLTSNNLRAICTQFD